MKKEMASSPTGWHFFSSSGVPFTSKKRAKTNPTQKTNGQRNDGLKLYPTFEWTSEGDLLLNTKQVDYKTTSGARVMGQKLGPENGMDRNKCLPGTYRLGPNLLPEFQGMSTIPTPTDVRDTGKQAHLLESGGGVCEVESIVPLAVL